MILPQKIEIPQPWSDIIFYVGLIGLLITFLYWLWCFLRTLKRKRVVFNFCKTREFSNSGNINLVVDNVSWRKQHNVYVEICFKPTSDDATKKVSISREKFSIAPNDDHIIKVSELTDNSIMIISEEYMVRYDYLIDKNQSHEIEFILRQNNNILDNTIISLKSENDNLLFSKI